MGIVAVAEFITVKCYSVVSIKTVRMDFTETKLAMCLER